MKYLFFIFILAFAPVYVRAQAITTKDTTYQLSTGGKFYEVREVEYIDGSGSVTRSLIGDTMTIFANTLNFVVSEGNRMASDAREVIRFDEIVNNLSARITEVLAVTGRDIFDTLAARYSAPLLAQGWAISEDTTGIDNIMFSINAGGQLRYQITGNPTRNAFIIGRVMRLVNYPGHGHSIDMYRMPGGNWISIDRRIKLQFPGNIDVREINLTPQPKIVAPPAEVKKPKRKRNK